jgi:hypothetical protein
MNRVLMFSVCLLAFLAFAGQMAVEAQGQFQVQTGQVFDQAVPGHFYLEGQAIPAQKRNASLVKGPNGRSLFALLDTSGYGADITEKYHAMMITEGRLSVCGQNVEIGSYGIGLKTTPGAEGPGTFFLYNQAGGKVFECEARRDANLAQPRPLQVVTGQNGGARLYIGRHFVELK